MAEQIDYTKRVLDDLDPATEGELIGQVQDRLARLQGEWVDATNARRALEPRIRSRSGAASTSCRLTSARPAIMRASGASASRRGRHSADRGRHATVAGAEQRGAGLRSRAAAVGAGAGITGDEEEPVDPLRTLAGMGIAGFGGRMARVKPPIAANAQRVAAEAAAGARNGMRMNAPLAARQSNVPAAVRAATKLTDDRAAMRWAEDVLSDAAGSPRMAEMDPGPAVHALADQRREHRHAARR